MTASAASRCATITVCRDCCCGTRGKHPDVDHDLLFDQLGAQAHGHAQVRSSGCLLACDRSNVVVVAPSTAGRMAGGRPVWFERVLDMDVVESIARWVRRGGPGCADLPDDLEPRVSVGVPGPSAWLRPPERGRIL